MLSAAQFMLPIDMEPLIAAVGIKSSSLLSSEESALNGSKADKFVTFMSEIRCFQELVTKFKELRVDTTEYTCLKAIVLFKTGKNLMNQWMSNEYNFQKRFLSSGVPVVAPH